MSPTAEPTREKPIKVPVKQKSSSFSPALKYKIISDDEVEFTKAKAFAFLELKTFDGERTVRERHVQFLFDEWAAGRFLFQNVILASARLGNDEYRINGQHTCWMRVNVPERNEPLKSTIRCMVYSVATEDQLRSLYSAFDRGAPRTVGHISRVLMMGGTTADGIPPALINQLIAGFKVYFTPDKWKREQMSINDWIGMIESNFSTNFGLVGRFLASHCAEARFSKRSSVIAAMLTTFEKNVKAAEEFWVPVLNGVNLQSKTDPRYQLRRYLDSHGHSIMGGMDKVSQEEMFCVCITQWNHWRDGNSVTTVKPVNTRPKVRA